MAKIQLEVRVFELLLKNPFNITHGSRKTQKTLIISLTKDGLTGYGEAVAVSYYGLDPTEMLRQFEALRPQLEDLPFNSPEAYWSSAHSLLADRPFLLCALDVAAHDWTAKQKGVPLYRCWGLSPDQIPLTSYTIGQDTIPIMEQKLKDRPWPIYKIKLGRADDLEVIQALRKHTDSVFRIDANTGWSLEQARELIPKLQALGVDMIEQPLRVDQWEDMKTLKSKSNLPLIADESCQKEEDVERCAPFFHGINIKIMKCGGLTPALRMIARARSLNLKVMVGCMIESSVGISANAHLLPLIDYADMDSTLLITEDPATGVTWQDGRAIFPDRPGTGAVLKTK